MFYNAESSHFDSPLNPYAKWCKDEIGYMLNFKHIFTGLNFVGLGSVFRKKILLQVSETKGAIAFTTGKFRTPNNLAFTYCLCVAVKRQVSIQYVPCSLQCKVVFMQ